MPFLYTIRSKVFLGVAAVATLAAVIATYATSYLGLTVALGAATGLALIGAWWVADGVATPLDALRKWAGRPEGRMSRLAARGEWTDLVGDLTGAYQTASNRAATAESELAHLRAVMDMMADGVLVADANARVKLVNRAAQSLLGEVGEHAVGMTVIECTMNADLDGAVRQALSAGGIVSAEVDLTYPQPRHFQATVTAAGDGAERAAVAVLHDTTETVRIENVRRDFVANVSHELRTPVSGIQTMAENLLSGAMDDASVARHFLQHILDASRRLVALVDDLLELARAESGRPPVVERLSVAAIVTDIAADIEHVAEAKRVTFTQRIPVGLTVMGAEADLRQIISNLLDNALKYSPDGGDVSITAEDSGETVLIQVADHGLGIAPEHHNRIFERFYRVDRARSREVGGTGLGLSIVKHLAEKMGGTVSVESAPGQGSVFCVRLPRPLG